MRPLHMPFHKILSHETLTANVATIRPESAVTRLVPFAFVFAQEPQRTVNKYSVDIPYEDDQSGINKPHRASKGSLPNVGSNMDQDMVPTLVPLIATDDITSKIVQKLPAV